MDYEAAKKKLIALKEKLPPEYLKSEDMSIEEAEDIYKQAMICQHEVECAMNCVGMYIDDALEKARKVDLPDLEAALNVLYDDPRTASSIYDEFFELVWK